MDNISINTFANTVSINPYDHTAMYHLLQSEYPDTEHIPLGNTFKQLEKIELKENEGYFEGSIELIVNNKTIIPRDITSSNLYQLWHDLYLTTVQQSHDFDYLDINYKVITETIDDKINIETHDLVLTEDGKRLTKNDLVTDISQYTKKETNNVSCTFESYQQAVQDGLTLFFEHLNHDFKRNAVDSPYYFELENIYKDYIKI
ncbi:hypothetical protein [Macrococcus epidermidis]|uniref:hypothetical protein n=1 Tax=Macrococcus epidermidis TaxID=1902580 RepID=UPI001EF28B60|nr:hypothetical protein [Macrococcus epidermidis]MCG7419822.1 hypothetical protein [Macrococcus epidermidis]UTH15608.1 hypothetical protein KFV12_09815 [Macrococcus epidermidis]